MSGPIVRTGTTPQFWKNYDNIFGKKPSGKKAEPAAAAKPVKKATKKKAVKKATKKKA